MPGSAPRTRWERIIRLLEGPTPLGLRMPGPVRLVRDRGTCRAGLLAFVSPVVTVAVGVIRSPADIAPEMAVRPPVPDPGTRVIPPPGAPGGDPTIKSK